MKFAISKNIILFIMILCFILIIIFTMKDKFVEQFKNIELNFLHDNTDIIVDDNDSNYKTISERFDKEKNYRKLINFLIKTNIIDKNKNFIDLGAWIGDNTIPWAKNINGIVYAIDPSKENVEYINKNKRLNDLSNIVIIHSAISDKDEYIYTSDNINHASFTNENKENTTSTHATSLDNLYNNKNIDNIGFMHLDVEGMEYKVLQGSKLIINTFKPIITYEVHLSHEGELEIIKNFLNNINYTSYILDEVCGGDNTCRNILAIPNTLKLDINTVNKSIGEGVEILKKI
jgi:FkbM family methyltransferase